MCTGVNFIKLVMFYMGVPYRHTLHNQILNSPTNSNLNKNKRFVILSEATAKSKNLKTDVSTHFVRST